jgi:hypothetical protein
MMGTFLLNLSSPYDKGPLLSIQMQGASQRGNLFLKEEAPIIGYPLIFQKITSAGIGTIFGEVSVPKGCRGFIGPVPPPLWIRASV